MKTFSPRLRLWPGLGRRATALVIALAIQVLILLALLSLSFSIEEPPKPKLTEVELTAQDVAEAEEPAPEESTPQPAEQSAPQPVETAAPVLAPAPVPVSVIPLPTAPVAPPPPATPPRPAPPAPVSGPAYGPPDTGRPASTDSVRVGTAPDGSPLYAAQWYRRPGKEFDGFLSEASPGYGMIACRTIPDFYVTDCVPIGESQGSMLARSLLAGSGVFRVRPPRLGGRSLVGAWVRIKIDYTITTRRYE